MCKKKKRKKKKLHVPAFRILTDFIYLFRCKDALDSFHSRLRSENFVPPRLTVSQLGHFYNKVLFAALKENQGLEDLKFFLITFSKT